LSILYNTLRVKKVADASFLRGKARAFFVNPIRQYSERKFIRMKIIVNGPLSEKELDACIRRVTAQHTPSSIETLTLDVHEDYIDVHYSLLRRRELRKMSGCCISEPDTWNSAKRAEFQDMLPNDTEVLTD